MITIENLTPMYFEKYGKILTFSKTTKENFEVIITEPANPWRLAMFRVLSKTCNRLECHPTSMESFEPVSGVGVLIVAEPQSPDNYHAFLLDQPVCLYKGVWHGMITLSDKTTVKIAENLDVNSEFHNFNKELSIQLVERM